MHLSSLVEMVESGFDERVLLGTREAPVTGAELGRLVRAGASTLGGHKALVYVGENHPRLPVALYSAAWAGIPFVPVNYRLEDHQLNSLIGRQTGALVLSDEATARRITGDAPVAVFDEWLGSLPDDPPATDPPFDDDGVAIILYTSGTTSEPKSALLRHRHLMAYLLGSVEFGGAGEDEAVLVAVPPYHVAGMANMLSNTFAGRRLVYLDALRPGGVAGDRARGGHHQCDGGPDDARPDRRAIGEGTRRRAHLADALVRRCQGLRSVCCSRRSTSSPRRASSTPMA